MEQIGKDVQISEENKRATEQAREIPFFDSYDAGSGKLSLRNATHFPNEIISFASKFPVKILNASGSEMSVLPEEFGQLSDLEIALFSDNRFEEVPEVLGKCQNLSIIAFKSNRISTWSENALPKDMRWIMLTGNQIENVPASIGNFKNLQKLALAGNRIQSIPDEMAHCENLELLRIAANDLKSQPPDWLLKHPKLTWYGDSGNPFCHDEGPEPEVRIIKHNEIIFSEHDLIGESPSSRVYKSTMRDTGEDVAVKIFKRGLTSDGYPKDDMHASIKAGSHRGLIQIIGKLSEHAEGKEGIVLSLVPHEYTKLGHPPDFKTCTRDTFASETSFPEQYILNVLSDISSACEHLHRNGVAHGDIYPHNILTDKDGRSLLGDFGAATIYDPSKESGRELLDVRAFGCLIEDMVSQTNPMTNESIVENLRKLQMACMNPDVSKRPSFSDIYRTISQMDIKQK